MFTMRLSSSRMVLRAALASGCLGLLAGTLKVVGTSHFPNVAEAVDSAGTLDASVNSSRVVGGLDLGVLTAIYRVSFVTVALLLATYAFMMLRTMSRARAAEKLSAQALASTNAAETAAMAAIAAARALPRQRLATPAHVELPIQRAALQIVHNEAAAG